MSMDWVVENASVIVGFVIGTISAIAVQVVSTTLTREKHKMSASIDKFKGVEAGIPGYEVESNESFALLIENKGHFVERDVDIRIQVLLAEPPIGLSIQSTGPQFVLNLSDELVAYRDESPYAELEPIFKYRLEYLAPKQKIRFDCRFDAELLEINTVAASKNAVASKDWKVKNRDARYQQARAVVDERLGIDWAEIYQR